MCGRSSLTLTEKQIEERFNASFYSDTLVQYNPLPNYNVAPSHYHPVITQSDPRMIQLYKWGLVPFWANDPKIGYKMINARKETVLEKPAYREAVKTRRCLIPIDGFYEWKKSGNKKVPFRIVPTNTQVVSLAGLCESWKQPDGQTLHTFTIITQEASKKISEVHNRMPAMLLPEVEEHWLDTQISPKEALDIIAPYPDDFINIYKVSSEVNSVKNNNPNLIIPIDEDDQKSHQSEQLSLF